MKKYILLIIIAFIFGTVITSGCTQNEQPPIGAISVAELIESPDYENDVVIYGHVNFMGELLCPCFELTYNTKSVQVWYDLMIKDDVQWDAIDVTGIENGNWVVVRGVLKTDNTQPPTFWAKSIEKTEPLIGGETDEHGCLVSAGYTWCEPKQKCLRIWEEECEEINLANPASVYCEEGLRGNAFSVVTNLGVKGYCELPDLRICEQWPLFNTAGKECIKPTEDIDFDKIIQ